MNQNNQGEVARRPNLVIVMGVSGSGKTTIAKKLSELNLFQFLEGDDYHSKKSIEKMANGIALDEFDRRPWIKAMCAHLEELGKTNTSYCLAYSGLKLSHRKQFTSLNYRVTFLHLTAEREVLVNNLKKRSDHFFDTNLLDSQFEALELPMMQEDVFEVSLENSIENTVLKAQGILVNEVFTKNFAI